MLLQPGLLGGSFHSFYELPFALPFLAGAVLYLVRGRPLAYALCVAGAWLFASDSLARRWLAVVPLGFAAIALNPLIAPLIARQVTGSVTYWRILWLLPVPTFLALALTAGARFC